MTLAAEPAWALRTDADFLGEFVRSRNEAAFAQVVRRHGGMVLSVCRSVLGNTADAEDAAQAVFLTLAQKASPRLARPTLAGWLHRVAWYISRRAVAARDIRRRHEQEAGTMRQQPVSPDQVPDAVPLEQLHGALADLPDKYRLPILLHHVEGRTQEETAALLGCRLSTVAMRLSRGRQVLRDRCNRRGAAVGASSMLAALAVGTTLRASTSFVATAVQAASAALGGHLATAGMPTISIALSKGAIKMLFWTKIKFVTLVVAAVFLASGAVGTIMSHSLAATQPATPPATPASFHGAITQVDAGSITLRYIGQSTSATINASTVVKVNGQVATAADLQIGMNAIVFAQPNQPATEIRAYTPQAPATTNPASPNFFGTITQVDATSITVQSMGQSASATINASTAITADGKTGTAAILNVGMHAGIWAQPNQPATKIVAYTPKPPATQPATPPATPPASPPANTSPNVFGTITQVDATSITVQSNGQSTSATINVSTAITADGKTGTAAILNVGMHAGIWAQPNQPATKILAYTPKPPATQPATPPPSSTTPNIFGTITQVGPTSITVQYNSQTRSATINSSTVIIADGKTGTAANLAVGMHAGIFVQPNQPATRIVAYTPKLPATQPSNSTSH